MEWCREINIDGIIKRIEVRCSDITKVDETYDLLVCSAFKRAYSPFDGTDTGRYTRIVRNRPQTLYLWE